MLTLNMIFKEIRNVPVDRLPDIYKYVLSLTSRTKKSDERVEKVMSYSGIFNEMSETEYESFEKELKNTRKAIFDRKVSL